MKIEIEITQEQAEKLAKGESIEIKTTVDKQIEKWEPKGGEFYIGVSGHIDEAPSSTDFREFGLERETKEEAKYARDQMRVHNRLLAYVAEFDKGWKADWHNRNQAKYFIYFDHRTKIFNYSYVYDERDIGNIYISEKCAKKLCEKLNAGEVEL